LASKALLQALLQPRFGSQPCLHGCNWQSQEPFRAVASTVPLISCVLPQFLTVRMMGSFKITPSNYGHILMIHYTTIFLYFRRNKRGQVQTSPLSIFYTTLHKSSHNSLCKMAKNSTDTTLPLLTDVKQYTKCQTSLSSAFLL